MDGIWVEYAADGNSIQRSRYDEGLFLYDLHWGPKELFTRAQKLRKKNIEQLNAELLSVRETQFGLRIKHKTGQLNEVSDLKKLRRKIALIKTLISEIKLKDK